MSELKAFNMPRYAGQFTTHEVYLKFEADKVIAHSKYKRCLATAKLCFEKSPKTGFVKYDKKLGCLRNFYDWWGLRWLELAQKFKEAK